MQNCKIMLFVCRWLLIASSIKYTHKKDAKFHRLWKRKMLFMTCCWKSWLLEGKSCRVVEVLQAIWTVRLENWYLAVPALQAKNAKWLQTDPNHGNMKFLSRYLIVCTEKTWRLRQTRELKRKGSGSRMLRYPPLYNSAYPPRHWFSRSKTGGRKPPPPRCLYVEYWSDWIKIKMTSSKSNWNIVSRTFQEMSFF